MSPNTHQALQDIHRRLDLLEKKVRYLAGELGEEKFFEFQYSMDWEKYDER